MKVVTATDSLAEHNLRQIADNLRTATRDEIWLWRNSWADMLDSAAGDLAKSELEGELAALKRRIKVLTARGAKKIS